MTFNFNYNVLAYQCSIPLLSVCQPGFYGQDCVSSCHVGCRGDDNSCHHVTGVCTHGCDPGYTGQMCQLSKWWFKTVLKWSGFIFRLNILKKPLKLLAERNITFVCHRVQREHPLQCCYQIQTVTCYHHRTLLQYVYVYIYIRSWLQK